MRVVNYNVSFAFVSDDGMIAGGLPEKKMSFDDIQHSLRLISPLSSVEWSNTIKQLPRNSYTIIEVKEKLNDGRVILKKIKVRR